MKQSIDSIRPTFLKIQNLIVVVGNRILSILYSPIYIYLLVIDAILRSLDRRNESKRGVLTRENSITLPTGLPERLSVPISNRLDSLNYPAGSISVLRKETVAQSLADWRDTFIKDMFLFAMPGGGCLKTNWTTQFINHKLEILRDEWPRIEPDLGLKGIGQCSPSFGYVRDLPEKKQVQLWDWRVAYRTENPDREIPDPEVMDTVERLYPNWGDKVRIKLPLRSRDLRDTGIPDSPNFRTEKEYQDPRLWEGVVVTVRNPGDSYIIVRLLHIFVSSSGRKPSGKELSGKLCPVHMQIPITLVDGLGRLSIKECDSLEIFRQTFFNMYGWDRDTTPDPLFDEEDYEDWGEPLPWEIPDYVPIFDRVDISSSEKEM